MASRFGLTLDAFAPTRAADGSWTPAPYVGYRTERVA